VVVAPWRARAGGLGTAAVAAAATTAAATTTTTAAAAATPTTLYAHRLLHQRQRAPLTLQKLPQLQYLCVLPPKLQPRGGE
jgi:hypothetical protein